MDFLNSLGGKIDLNFGPLRIHVNLDEAGAAGTTQGPETLEEMKAVRDELARHIHNLNHKIEKMQGTDDDNA